MQLPPLPIAGMTEPLSLVEAIRARCSWPRESTTMRRCRRSISARCAPGDRTPVRDDRPFAGSHPPAVVYLDSSDPGVMQLDQAVDLEH